MKGSRAGIPHPSCGQGQVWSSPWLPRERAQGPHTVLTTSILASCLICSPLIEQMRCRQRGPAGIDLIRGRHRYHTARQEARADTVRLPKP